MPVPGDGIAPEIGGFSATIGCFAQTTASGRAVALTAMHLVTDARLEPSTALRFRAGPPAVPNAEPLGRFYRGTLRGTDAAAILLDAGVLHSDTIREIGPIRGARAPTEADRFKAIRMFGIGSGRCVIGRVESFPIAIPELDLDLAFLASLDTRDGDSGAAIVTTDGQVIGLLTGRYRRGHRLSVCTSITSVLAAVRCRIG